MQNNAWKLWSRSECNLPIYSFPERGPARGGSHFTRLNFKTSRVSGYKCLSLIVGFAVTVTIWPREVVSCRDFILRAFATFWAMSVVGIYPGRASRNMWKNSHVILCLKEAQDSLPSKLVLYGAPNPKHKSIGASILRHCAISKPLLSSSQESVVLYCFIMQMLK